MTKVKRGTASGEGVINSDIDTVWNLLTDWGNHEWWTNDIADEDMTAGRTYLEGEKGKVPRTKVIERSNSGNTGAVRVNREVLLHEDPIVHRLYYTCSDGLLPYVRNYLASWTLDVLDGGRCKMSVTADFDITEPGDLDYSRNTFEAVYQAIFKNVDSYLKKR